MEHVAHVLYAQDRHKVDEIRRGHAFAHIALIVILACVLYTVLGLIINVKILLPIAADMLKNRHFFIYGHVHKCISTANKTLTKSFSDTYVVRSSCDVSRVTSTRNCWLFLLQRRPIITFDSLPMLCFEKK